MGRMILTGCRGGGPFFKGKRLGNPSFNKISVRVHPGAWTGQWTHCTTGNSIFFQVGIRIFTANGNQIFGGKKIIDLGHLVWWDVNCAFLGELAAFIR